MLEKLSSLLLISFIASTVSLYSAVSIFLLLTGGSVLDIGNALRTVLLPLEFVFFIPVFGLYWAGIHGLLQEMRKRGTKMLLLILCLLVVVPAGFTASLNGGVLDSVTLLSDSVIDLSSCTAFLKIKNDGSTVFTISTIEIGGLVCDISWLARLGESTLGLGETMAFDVYYAHSGYESYAPSLSTGAEIDPNPYDAVVYFDSNIEITPTTFTEGKCAVVLHSERLLAHRLEVEAKFVEPEEIEGVQTFVYNLHEERINDQNFTLFGVDFNLNMTFPSVACIYSVDVGNLTIKFNPPIFVQGSSGSSDDYYSSFALGFSRNEIFVNPHSARVITAIPSRPLDAPIFTVGQTYKVSIRTMTNRNYTTSMTIMPGG